jgi:8-oxo-dGTP pyrophosphatase MutT (NUDIX family)
LLLVEEKSGPRKGTLGLPGGIADPGENFIQGALRELREETGLEGQFLFLYSVRHAYPLNYGQDDLYFVSVFGVGAQEITLQESEISGFQWVKTRELDAVEARTIGTGKVVIQRLAQAGKRGVRLLQQRRMEVIEKEIVVGHKMDIRLLPLF